MDTYGKLSQSEFTAEAKRQLKGGKVPGSQMRGSSNKSVNAGLKTQKINVLDSEAARTSQIATAGKVTKKDIEFLIETLRKRYGLVCKVFSHNGYPRIRIQSQSVIAFNKVVQPYIHSIFQYKIIPREELKGYYAMKVPELRALCKNLLLIDGEYECFDSLLNELFFFIILMRLKL